MTRAPAPGESAEAMLVEMRAALLLEQRRQLRSQRRSFVRIAAQLDWELKVWVRDSLDLNTGAATSAEYERRRAALATAVEQTDAALVRNAEALAVPVPDAFQLLEYRPDNLTDIPRVVQHRARARQYQANLRLVAKEEKAAA